jgi:hypothetical protein
MLVDLQWLLTYTTNNLSANDIYRVFYICENKISACSKYFFSVVYVIVRYVDDSMSNDDI